MRLRALLLLTLAAGPAAAQTAPDSLGEVTVTAAREAVATRDAPVRVTVIDRAALDATAAPSVAGALQARAPLHVRRYGPSGLSTVTIRGASSSQALVLLEGQRLSSPQLGQVDLGLVPTALLESVEVLSGPASGLYGADAMGGVVHLRPHGAGGDRAQLTTEAGPWGERHVSVLGRAGSGGVRGLVAADLARADDDYSVVDRTRIGEPRVARQGWDSRRAALYAALRADAERQSGALALWLADAERGLGGDGTVGERQWDRLAQASASAQHRTSWGRLDAALAVQRARLRYANPFPSARPDALDETGVTAAGTLDLRATALRPDGAWSAALTAGLGTADHPSLDAAAADRHVGIALSGTQRWGRLTLFPVVRADVYAPAGGDRQRALSPQLGVNVALGPAVALKASAARAFRMPTLNDRFWRPGGNPDLRPETAWSADAGAVWSGPGLRAEGTVFGTAARDQIVWAPTGSGFWAPENVARTRVLGAEASVRGGRRAWGAALDGGALATLLDARDRDAREPLRYVPRWTLKAWGGAQAGPLRLGLGLRLVGARPTTTTGSQPLPAHAVLDAHLGVRQSVGAADVALALALDNLTDARYEIVRSYPMPPRHARLRLTVQTR